MQIFVDDPVFVTRGTQELRAWRTGALLLFWCVLGFNFNWRKAHRGSSVPWIGAQVTLKKHNGKWGTLTELMPTKVKEMRGNVDKLFKAKGMVDIK